MAVGKAKYLVILYPYKLMQPSDPLILGGLLILIYSPEHKCWPKTSLAGNQGNHQNFDPSLLPKNFWLLLMGLSNFFLKNKIQMADLKKTKNLKCQFSIFLPNWALLVLGSVGLIDAKGNNVIDSTDMVVRLSYIRPKTVKKTHFFVFFSCFRSFVGQPDNHIG